MIGVLVALMCAQLDSYDYTVVQRQFDPPNAVIPPGGTAQSDAVLLQIQCSPPIIGPYFAVYADFEVKPASAEFDETGLIADVFVDTDGTATATITGLLPGQPYHWRARQKALYVGPPVLGPWTTYGSNPAFYGPALPKPAVSNLSQLRSTLEELPTGASTNTLLIAASVDDPDSQPMRMLVEVRPAGVPFAGTATHQSAWVSDGRIAIVQVDDLPNGEWHWRAWALTVDLREGDPVASGGSPDFVIDAPPPPADPPASSGSRRKDERKTCSGSASGSAGALALAALLAAGLAVNAFKETVR